MVIYLDILLALNMAVTYFCLLGVAALSPPRPKFLRLLLSGCIGGASSLIIFADINTAASLLFKAAVCPLITLAAFGWVNFRRFFRRCLLLLTVTFIYGGVMTAIYSAFSPDNMAVRSGAVYFNISPIALIISISCAYILIKLASYMAMRLTPSECRITADIFLGGRSVPVTALVDSGDRLRDLYTGCPVIIIGKASAERLLQSGAAAVAAVAAGKCNAESMPEGFRLLPYSAVGHSGMLPAFSCDKAVLHLKHGDVTIGKITAAVSERRLSDDYDAIIGKDFLHDTEEYG